MSGPRNGLETGLCSGQDEFNEGKGNFPTLFITGSSQSSRQSPLNQTKPQRPNYGLSFNNPDIDSQEAIPIIDWSKVIAKIKCLAISLMRGLHFPHLHSHGKPA